MELAMNAGKTKIAVMYASFGIVAAAFAAKVEYIDFQSESMQKSVPVSVILPDAYETDANVRFPVVFALHGHSGESKNFYQARPGGLLPNLADQYGFIAVCPDGGYFISKYLAAISSHSAMIFSFSPASMNR